nr:MAG TPA: bacteriocin [Caudoviricetes sp.]
MTLSMKAATFAAKALNLALSMVVGALIGMAINGVISAIADYAQRIDTAATKTKEEADAVNNATSSLKDLVNAYEELGDKSGWNTEDFDQAKDIQEELLALAKEQGTLDENKVNKLDLQNGKYEEQLGLLKDITEEQLKASESKLIQSKDAQGNKLVKTAKDNNRSHFFSSVSANTNRGIMNELKDAGIDVFNKNGSFGVKDLNDPDSIAKYYSELGKALDYIVQNTTEAQRAAGGAYHTVYQYLMDEQAVLQDDADAYNDSTDAVNENVNARRKLQAIDFWSDGKSNGMDVSYSFDKVNSAIETLKNTIDDFDASKLNDLLWGTNEGLTDEQAQALAALRKALTDMDFSADTDGVNAFIQALVQVGIVAQSSANGVDALAAGAQKMEDISSKMDEIQSAYKASTSAMEEYNQYGYMSLDSLQSLLTMNTEYLNCLELVNGKLQINKQSYAELLAAEYAEAAATILSNAQHEVANLTADDTAESTDDLKEKTEAEKTALENLLPALKNATAATATYSAAQEFANEVEKAGERGVDPAKLEEITNRTNTQLSLLYTNMNAALKGGQALTNQLNGFGSSSKNAGKSSSTTSKSVADLSSAFDTLTKAMKEYNQYGYISADTMKSLIGVDDKFTACLTEQNGKLELNTAKFRTFVRAQLEEANAANDGGKSAGEMKKILDWLNSSVDSETISFEQLTDAIKGYGTAMDEAKEKTDAIKSAFSGLYDIQQKIKNSQFGVGDLDATESKIESILQLSKFFGDNKDLMDNLVDKNGNINLNTEAFKKATLDELDKRIKAANETGGAAATALANSLSSDKANIESGKISVSDYLVGLGTDLERVNTELDKYQTNWSTLKDAMDEWNTTGQLTQDTMQKLQELPEEFSNLLTYDEDGNAKIDVKALRQSYVDKLSAFAKEFEGSPIGIQVQAMIDDVREPTPEEYKALAEKTATYQKALAQYTKKMSAIDSNKDLSEDEALQQKAEVQKELDEAMEKALLEVQETDAQVTTKLKKHWDGVEKVIEEFKSALSDAKAVLSSFLSLLSTLNDKSNNDLKIWGDAMGKVIDKRIKALNKQKEALEENNEATERAIELSKAQDALARAQQQRTTRVYTENGYEWQANAEDVRTAREDLADKQREWNKKDAEKAIDDQIKKYNEFKDKLSEVMDDIGKSWKDYQKELEYTAQIQKMTLTQMEGSLDSYHNKIIASLNTSSAITSIQNLIANLESLINTLTKVNNLYSMLKTGEYKDLGTKGLWNTIKGFFNKGKSENVNKSFKDTFNAAKKAFNAGKKQLTDTATTGATDVINAMINQIKTSGNGLIETFGGIWDKIKVGAQSLFRGSGSGGGIISTFVNGFKAIGNAVSKSKIGSTILGGIGKVGTTLLSGGGKLLAGAGKLIGTAGSALAAAGPYAIPIAAAAGLGIYGGIKSVKHQKEIWSNKEDGFGKKAIKSVATFFWDISPIGAIVNLCKDISGKSKKTAENTKDTADSSSETAENTKHSATNLTINATQIVSKEENKATDETDKKNDATGNEDQTVKTAATTLTGAGLGAAAGMAIGGPAGALIGTLLGGFAGFFFGRHANGLKSSKTNHFANVDERGSELIVRKPASGRYTYLETGDGVVPADITSRLFEMGGNPDKWFSDQLAKHSSASMVQSRDAGGISLSIGDVNVNNPVGDSDALARELVNRLPNKVVQELNRR